MLLIVASSAAHAFAGCMAVVAFILAFVAGMGAAAASVIRAECSASDTALDSEGNLL